MNLNLLLLGLPSSGKSALLGALQQVAQSKSTELNAELVDLSGELSKLKSSSDDAYKPTRDDIATYPVQVHSSDGEHSVTLVDTSGAKAGALLADGKLLDSKDPIPAAVTEADAIILTLDITADQTQQIKQFIKFLKGFELRRSTATAVAGLPIFVVLTKCDRLARGDDKSPSGWIQAVEDAKRKVDKLLRQNLAHDHPLSFGQLDYRVWATATKRPATDEKASRRADPYQVGTLFRQVFEAASDYRRRADRSHQALHAALVGMGGLLLLMAVLAGWYHLTQPTVEEAALHNRAQTLVATLGNVAEQVREPLDDRLKEIHDVRQSPSFSSLPADVQSQLNDLERSIQSYKQLNADFQARSRNPRLVVKEADLAKIELVLSEFDEPLAAWADTRLAKRQKEWKVESMAIRKAIDEEVEWIKTQMNEGEKLRKEGGLVIARQLDPSRREAWFAEVNDYLLRGRRHKATDRLPGTNVPYRVIYQFDRVEGTEREFRQFKERLDQLREEALRDGKRAS